MVNVKFNAMKKNVMLVIALLITSIAFAQTNHKGQRVGQTERMKEVLSLSDEQYATVKSVDKKYAEKFKELRQEKATARENYRKLHEEHQAEINKVLTEAQQQSWKEYRAQQRAEHKKAFEDRRQKRASEFKSTLNLSDEQINKLKDTNKKFGEQRRELMKDSSLSKEEKKAKFKSLFGEHEAAIKEILTPEQYEKWKSERKSHHGKKHQLKRGHKGGKK